MKFDTNWIVQLQKELDDRLHHAPATFTAGAHSIALDPDTAASIVDEYMGLLSGYAIAEGLSPFAREALGSVIAPDGLTIKSLTHGEGLSETQYFDRNGITSLDLTVIEKGTLSTLFLSKASADRLGLMPNGQPNPLNVIVSGTLSENNLHGVSFLFTNLAGMHTIDSATGNFALEGEGYEIKNGKISHYVKNV